MTGTPDPTGRPETAAGATTIALPDITPYRRGNTGIDYVTRLESGQPGPEVTIVGLTHGNEPCGAVALDHMLREGVRPARGALTMVFANARAYLTFDPARPTEARFLAEDLNRLWAEADLAAPAVNAERQRALELRPIVDASDCLLDLHSMQRGHRPLLLAGPTAKGRRLAHALGADAEIVADEGHPNGLRLRDHGGFSREDCTANALLAECGPHLDAATATAAIDIAWRFLVATGTIERETAGPHLLPGREANDWIDVTHRLVPRHDGARLVEDFDNLAVIARAGTPVMQDGPELVKTPYDHCILVMPARRLARGQTAVRLGRRQPFGDGDVG